MQLRRPIQVAAAVLGMLGVGVVCLADGNEFSRIIGQSGQICVFCDDPAQGAALAAYCEDVRGRLLKRLNENGAWRAPIVVVVRPRPKENAPPMPGEESVIRCSATSVLGYIRFQVEFTAPPPVDAARFVRALVGSLCAEVANRGLGKVSSGQSIARVPAWLVAGLSQNVRDDARHAALVELKAAMGRGSLLTFEQITETWAMPTDPREAAAYDAQCAMLVEALEEEQDGHTKLRAFLTGLKPAVRWGETFLQAFGTDFSDPATVERWWSSRAASKAAKIVPQALSAPETRRRLEEALQVVLPTAQGAEANTVVFDEIMGRGRDAKMMLAALSPNEVRLMTLSPLAHPLYRTVIGYYLDAIKQLRKENTRQFKQLLSRATQERRDADRRSEAIARYVGSVEASMLPEDFANRLGGWFKSGSEEDSGQPRQTPVRDYLDRVESTQPQPK